MKDYTGGKWEFQDSDERIIIVGGKNREYIASVQIKQIGGGAIAGAMEAKRKANAQRIVKCCNQHDGLVDALKGMQRAITILCTNAPDCQVGVNTAMAITGYRAKAKQALAIAGKEVDDG